MQTQVSHDEAKSFYEDFSLAVGTRDWLQPNARHLTLKLLIKSLLGERRSLQIADVGCGAGVMTDFLTRFGDVVGVDFSTAAIEAARKWAPRAQFRAGGVEALPAPAYDLITLFDVLEHIPTRDRAGLISALQGKLTPNGLLFFSTPHPGTTRRHREVDPSALQIIDEEVEVRAVIEEAAESGLQLLSYATYDVWGGSPEYQAMVFSPTRQAGGAASLMSRRFRLERRALEHRVGRRAYRVARAVQAARMGDLRSAAWFVSAKVPAIKP